MEKSTLEMLVLGIGVLVILAGVYLLFISSDKSSPFMANIVFSVGFLFYVIYTAMTTSSLQNNIREKEAIISNLQDEVKRKTVEVESLNSEVSQLNSDLKSRNNELEAANKNIDDLSQSVKALEKKITALTEKSKDSSTD